MVFLVMDTECLSELSHNIVYTDYHIISYHIISVLVPLISRAYNTAYTSAGLFHTRYVLLVPEPTHNINYK